MTPDVDTLPDAIRAAASHRVEEELRPALEVVKRLTLALDAFYDAVRAETEGRVLSSVLAALGQQSPPAVPADKARATLRAALLEASALVGDVGVVAVQVAAPPAPAARVVPPPPSTPAPSAPPAPPTKRAPPRPAPSPEEVERAVRLVEEIGRLSEDDGGGQHAARLRHHLQALAAESRLCMSQLPPEHPLSERLSKLIPVLGSLKTRGGVTEFVKGLAFGASDDWARVASESRRRVAQYDQDAAAPAPTSTRSLPKASAKSRTTPERTSLVPWPELARLRAALAGGSLVVVGGLVVQAKLDLYAARFGVKPEWHETDGDAAQSIEILAKRIRAGGISAIIMLEGLMAHTACDKVVAACKAGRVPFALGDKGGTGSIADALDQIERGLECGHLGRST